MTFPAKHITISIHRSFSDVYNFSSRPENFPLWAQGLSGSLQKDGEDWIADSPMGKIKIKFSPTNSYGVLDHDVTLPNGKVFHNPLRILKNEQGSEVVFTLYRQPEVSDLEFNNDAAQVAKDLAKLKMLLEK